MRMMVPLPNWRSICVSAPCRAVSRALAAASWLIWTVLLLQLSESRDGDDAWSVGRNEGVREGVAGNNPRVLQEARESVPSLCARGVGGSVSPRPMPATADDTLTISDAA